uniref:ARAD1B23958p n=1 Tax=Blastobotrys adeninivorans TaxID=409370 RepID=A0A060TDD9_BLAAD
MFIPTYDTDANGRKLYPVLLLKKDDWITYHAAKIFLIGCLCPPVWLILWFWTLRLSWANNTDAPSQDHLLTLLNDCDETLASLEAILVNVYSEDYSLNRAAGNYMMEWVWRSISGSIVYGGLAIVFYGVGSSA